MNTPGSLNRVTPFTRKVTANSVLPQPAAPHTSDGRPVGRPPKVIASKPVMPVGALGNMARNVASSGIGWSNSGVRERAVLARGSFKGNLVDPAPEDGFDKVGQGAVLLDGAAARFGQQLGLDPDGNRLFHNHSVRPVQSRGVFIFDALCNTLFYRCHTSLN